MTFEQVEAYAVHVRIQEITQQLRADEVIPLADHRRRSASPEPEYDALGRRTNTRYRRCRERLEKERDSLIQTATRTFDDYRPPHGANTNKKEARSIIEVKVYLPINDFPGVKFIGQLLGPRGSSLKEMNTQSGATIVIRGKGSVKAGRARQGSRTTDNWSRDENDPLHCLIRADAEEKIDKAKGLVQTVIDEAITAPEGTYERKRQQLRDLAVMNGTFRDDEGYGRRSVEQSTPSITCSICSGGHVSRDCPEKRRKLPPWRKAAWCRRPSVEDQAYKQLLLELGIPQSPTDQ